MEIKLELIYLNLENSKHRLGTVVAKYYAMPHLFELRYYVPEEKLWVKMPEIWSKVNKKVQFAWWETKEESDEFQEIMLKLICEKQNQTLEEIKKFRQDWLIQEKLKKSKK